MSKKSVLSSESLIRIKEFIGPGDFFMRQHTVLSCDAKNLRVNIVKNIQENSIVLAHSKHLNCNSTVRRIDYSDSNGKIIY